ncbi:MAG: hypothetical protein COV59_05525 [Candidatus Magasanikbacteria bacterium CG11_big_fil_rev_8_21_14_0_20_39_34]|uniref:Uncharacterized protein n=1 Tax=Candidatus Magasanikbacteria bacterium CG11_big_fil_rev_8_21_14_0_20_39_34 TaxID=1974653 RepID=A0A2H0N3Z1_9BACT|nr:MAG: hypothetical protein COV59_05525 [Candidatus Magasanikbacteria bacterium CG11_big_fil_rev_8_21_14_0_20_39_34]
MKKFVFLGIIFGISFFWFSVGNAASCQLTVGNVYKVKGSPSVYYVSEGCKKRPIRSGDVFFSYFTAWSEVITTTQDKLKAVPDHELGFLPWGPKREFQNGSLVKTTDDGKVYLYVNGELKPIADAAAFSAQGLKWEWIEDVAPEVVAKFKKAQELTKDSDLPKSTVFKYDDSADVYVLDEENGQKVKRHIQSIDELKKLYRLDRILVISRDKAFQNGLVLNPQDTTDNTEVTPRPGVGPIALPIDVKRVSDIRSIQEALKLFYADHGYYPEGKGTFDGMLMTSLCEDGFSDLCRSKTVYMKSFPRDPGKFAYEFENFTGKSYTITFQIESPVGNLKAGTIVATPEGMKTIKQMETMKDTSSSDKSGGYVSCAPDLKTGDADIELCKGYIFHHIPSNIDITVRGFDQNKLDIHMVKHKDNGKTVDFNWTLYKGEKRSITFFDNAGTLFELTYKGQELMVKGRGIIPLLNIKSVVTEKHVSTDADLVPVDPQSDVAIPPSAEKLPCKNADSYGALYDDMNIHLCPLQSWHQLQGKFAIQYVDMDTVLETIKLKVFGMDGDDPAAGRLVTLKLHEGTSFMIGSVEGKPYHIALYFAGEGFYMNEAFFRMSVIPEDGTKRCYTEHKYEALGEEDTFVDICVGQILGMLHGNFRMKLISVRPGGEVTLNVSRVKEYNWNDGQDLILQPGNSYELTTTDAVRSEFAYKISLVYKYQNADGNPVFALKAEKL